MAAFLRAWGMETEGKGKKTLVHKRDSQRNMQLYRVKKRTHLHTSPKKANFWVLQLLESGKTLRSAVSDLSSAKSLAAVYTLRACAARITAQRRRIRSMRPYRQLNMYTLRRAFIILVHEYIHGVYSIVMDAFLQTHPITKDSS